MRYEKLLVERILRDPISNTRQWTLQGFGMLRLYLNDDIRLHVWDSMFRVKPDPSDIHDHPWDFESVIIAGMITNYTYLYFSKHVFPYLKVEEPKEHLGLYKRLTITPGLNLKKHEEEEGWIVPNTIDTYIEGDSYIQKHSEIHHTGYRDGTVTIVKRDRKNLIDIAHSFYPQEFISGKPRIATKDEVKQICSSSLERWFQ